MMDQNQLESQMWVFYKLNYQKMEKQKWYIYMPNLIWYKQFDQYVFDLVVRPAAKVE